jgi:uncharacterized protein YndB with AHSA1/START domain
MQIAVRSSTHSRHGGSWKDEIHLSSLSILMDMQFHAAPARLLHAWTIPEYVETWLTAPGIEEIRCSREPQPQNGFSIDLRSPTGVITSIYGEYLSIDPGRIVMSWQLSPGWLSGETALSIAIRSSGRNTGIRLSHTGFRNTEDWQWAQQLWLISLTKMSRLIR